MAPLQESNPRALTTDILGSEREEQVRGQPPNTRRKARQEQAAPLIGALYNVLDDARRRLSPKSEMAKAITYGLKRWPALTRFLGDGRLEIENNIPERALRSVAIGRKPWLIAR